MVVQNGATFLSSLETTFSFACFHLACPNCSAEALDPNTYLLKLGHEEALTKHTKVITPHSQARMPDPGSSLQKAPFHTAAYPIIARKH